MRIGKNKLFKYIPFEDIDCPALSLYLEEMASNGWLLYDIVAGISKFKKTNPQEIKFSIDIFDEDANSKKQYKEYLEMCSAAGWEHICSFSKCKIFCTKDKNAIPIQTDLNLELKNMVGNVLFFIVMPLLPLVPAFISNVNLQYSINNIVNINNANISDFFLSILLIVFFIAAFLKVIIEIIINTTWFFKTKKSLKNNNEIKYIGLKSFKSKMNIRNYFIIYCLIILILMLVPENYYSPIYMYCSCVLIVILTISISIMSIVYFARTLKEI